MHKSNDQIEEQLQEQSKAPRVTPDAMAAKIAQEEYHVFRDSCMTVCCLTLENGFNVIGESACAYPENFNEQIGRDLAFNKAKSKVYELEGYLLKQRRFEEQQ